MVWGGKVVLNVAGQGQKGGHSKGGQGTLWREDEAMADGQEAPLEAGMQCSKGPIAVSWFYLLTK